MIGSHRIARDTDRSRRAETMEQWKITRSPTPGCMLARASNPVATMAIRDNTPCPHTTSSFTQAEQRLGKVTILGQKLPAS